MEGSTAAAQAASCAEEAVRGHDLAGEAGEDAAGRNEAEANVQTAEDAPEASEVEDESPVASPTIVPVETPEPTE